jgi:hypothetical protein
MVMLAQHRCMCGLRSEIRKVFVAVFGWSVKIFAHTFDCSLGILNKVHLQSYFRNPYVNSWDEPNKVFDYMIKGCLL